jgi:hypothetical protein
MKGLFRERSEEREDQAGEPSVRQLPSASPGVHGLDAFRRGVLEGDEGFSFFRNPLILSVLSVSVLLLLASFATIGSLVYRVPQEIIILHYNVYFGIDIIGRPWQAFVVPGAPLVFFFVNLVLAHAFYGVRERVISHILLFSAFFAAFAGAVVSVALLFINS